jgi:transcriptional regulator with XRE-family HTH domain
VRLLRGYLRLSQEALGQRVGVSKSTISGIERGAQGISGIAGKLAEVLGTTTDYLYGLTDNPLPPNDEQLDEETKRANPVVDAILAEVEHMDEIDQQVIYQMAVTLRLAKERRRTQRVIE